MMLFFKKSPAPTQPEAGLLRYGEKEIPYRVVRSRKRRRTVSLSMKHGAGLRLLVPMRITGVEIKRILQRRADWIGYQFNALQKEKIFHQQELAEGQALPYLGTDYRLVFTVQSPVAVCVVEDRLEVNTTSEKTAHAIATFYKEEADAYLRARLNHWADVLGVTYQSLKLSNARRLWGSCSARNAIRINWRIIMAPPDVIDYLLVHELCHIPHKNHGARFWQKVESLLPDYKARQKILRSVESGLLARFR